jgi:threonine/homoserine/homoserine lactone efflux protein
MEDKNMQGQIQYPGNIPGARTTTMQNGVGGGIATGFGIAAGVGLFILAMYGLSYALRGK